MGTELTGRPGNRQRLYEELAADLQVRRGGVHAQAMAEALIRHAAGSRELIALIEDGQRAVFYTANTRMLVAVPFDEHGLDVHRGSQDWGPVSDPASWVDAKRDLVEWVNPRYRWCLD